MICHGYTLPTKKLKYFIFSLERGFKRVSAGLLKVVSTGKHVVFDNECSPSIGVLFDNAWVDQFQAACLCSEHRGHGVAKGIVVMNINPEATMVREGTEAKFKVPANIDVNGGRGEDTINRIRTSIKGCRRMGGMA
jgi:hypothetical protein